MYADSWDMFLLISALLGTAVMSGAGPLFAIAWGGATDDVNDAEIK